MQATVYQPTNSYKAALTWHEIVPMLLIAGFGFLVDVYDLVVFSVVRISSLTSLGIPAKQLLQSGILLLNLQMAGMMIGGFIWGVIGDKYGRKTALFGSILMYSTATLLNGLVTTLPVYALLRIFSGIGLAGEVGAAMTIAAEVTPPKYRAYGTALVAGLGTSGAILASYVASFAPWRMVFLTGGLLGLLLLLARLTLKEPPLFSKIETDTSIQRGSIKLLLTNKKRCWCLIRCVLAAVPLWFVLGVMVAFAPEVCKSIDQQTMCVSVAAVTIAYAIGETLGEIGSGIVSQFLHSRRMVMFLFLFAAMTLTLIALHSPPLLYRLLCIPLGFSVGYWSVVITTTAEQFGTNLRATATTLVPNLVRASVIPLTLLFSLLATRFSASTSALIVGTFCFVGALISIFFMEETFGKELDFIES